MKKKVLITGGTGFLGSSLTRKLVKEGYNVIVFDNDSRGSRNRLDDLKDDFVFLGGDIRDKDSVEKACKGIDIVVHLAYVNGTEFFYSKPELVLEVGVKGMINVLDSCMKHNVPELFLASSSEIYNQPQIIPTPEEVPMVIPDPKNPRFSYGGGKIISELLVLNYGRKYFKRVVVFRPHNVYGPDMGYEHVIPQFALRIKELHKKNGKKFAFPIQGSGRETRAFIYIDDFTEGLLLLLMKGKHEEIYNIGTEDEVTIETLAKKIANVFNCSIKIIPSKVLPGSTLRRCPDTRKIISLGFRTVFSLDQGLENTIGWYSQSGQKIPNAV